MKKVLALVAALAVCGNVLPADAKKDAKPEVGFLDTLHGYSIGLIEEKVKNNPKMAVAAIVALTLIAERAAMYVYDNYVAENDSEDDLDVA